MPFIRKVKTASGAVGVQVAYREAGRDRVVKHFGSAHSDAELALLVEKARAFMNPGQMLLPLDQDLPQTPAGTLGAPLELASPRCQVLWDVLEDAYNTCGFNVLADEGFKQLVLGRIIEPTSKLDTVRVLKDIGISPVHRNTFYNTLGRCVRRDYRSKLGKALN